MEAATTLQEVGDKSSMAYVVKAMRKACDVAGIEPFDVPVFDVPVKKSADGERVTNRPRLDAAHMRCPQCVR